MVIFDLGTARFYIAYEKAFKGIYIYSNQK